MNKQKVSSFLIGLFSISIFFTACENFLDDGELKNKLEKQIEYANAAEVVVQFSVDKNAIDFIAGNNDLKLKPTDTKYVEFELNDEHFTFIDCNVVNKYKGDEDCSDKLDIKVTQKENVYTLAITLKAKSPDLLVTLVSRQKPEIYKATPEYYPSGISCYKPIVLYFTQPMKKSDVEGWGNIKIESKKGDSLTSCFNFPELSEDGKTLVIRPIQNKVLDLLADVATYEIKVSVAAGLKDDSEYEEVMPAFTHSYVINKTQDDEKPVLSEIRLSKEKINLKTREKYILQLDQEVFSDSWSNEKFEAHHVYNQIFISCKGSDASSGVKGLVVTETRLRDENGSEKSDVEKSTPKGTFIEVSDGNFELDNFCYNFVSGYDGVIKLDFKLVDYDDNESDETETFYVVKDTTFNSYYLDLCSDTNAKEKRFPVNSGEYNGLDVLDKIEYISAYDKLYSNIYNPISLDITYWDEGEEENVKQYYKIDIIEKTSSYKHYFDSPLPKIVRDPQKNTYIRIVSENEYGQKAERIQIIPASLYISIDGYDSETGVILLSQPGTFYSRTYYYQKKKTGNLNYNSDFYSINSSNSFSLDPGYTYKFYMFYMFESVGFINCLADPIEFQITKDSSGKFIIKSVAGIVPGGLGRISDDKFPKIDIQKVTSNGINSGSHHVEIEYLTEGDPNYNFRLVLVNENNSKYIYPESNVFDVPTGDVYFPNFIVYDKYNFEIASTIDSNYSDFYLRTDFNYRIYAKSTDNIPPDISGGYISFCTPNSANIYIMRKNSDIDANLEKKFYYYIIKNTDGTKEMEYSEKLLADATECVYENQTSFDPSSKLSVLIPLNIPENGFYTIFYKLKDTYGNYSIDKVSVSAYVGGELDLSKSSTSGNKISIPSINAYGVALYYWNNGSWIRCGSSSVFTASYEFNTEYTISVKDNTTDDEARKFVRLITNSRYDGSFYSNYNKTVYLCPDYFINKRTIKNKGMLELSNGYQFFIDQPTYVRVLYSVTDWGNDPDMWGTRGLESGVTVESSSFTYIPDTTEVLENNYYCVVAHFADGTSLMSSVKQKK